MVWIGRVPGIYSSWVDAQAQVNGFQGARFRSYPTEVEAKAAYEAGPTAIGRPLPKPNWHHFPEIDRSALAVDAACSGNPGKMEYRGVWLTDDEEWFHCGPYPNGTNNIGEYLALVHALAMMVKTQQNRRIYTDSETGLAWIRAKGSRSKLSRTADTEVVWDLLDRADRWLTQHDISQFSIQKWHTEKWGEIPADFGRK